MVDDDDDDSYNDNNNDVDDEYMHENALIQQQESRRVVPCYLHECQLLMHFYDDIGCSKNNGRDDKDDDCE